jgi:uncharacterized membrane protein (UPF0127 family)
MIEDISNDFKENGVCSISSLMRRYRMTREKAIEVLGHIVRMYDTLEINKDRNILNEVERIYLTEDQRVVHRMPAKPKKEHPFKNTDEEWQFILECRNENE